MNFEALTPELVGLILSFDVTDDDLRNLWLCGSRRLQHRITKGLTRFSRVSKQRFSRAALPSFLQDCTALRFLSLYRDSGTFHAGVSDFKILMAVSNTLSELHLNCPGSILLLDASYSSTGSSALKATSPTSSDPLPPRENRISSFTALHTLKLRATELLAPWIVALFPRELTSLSMALNHESKKFNSELIAALPPHLQILDIPGRCTMSEPQYASLPASLTHLSIEPMLFPSEAEIQALPRKITHLELRGSGTVDCLTTSRCHALPVGLLSLAAPIAQASCLDVFKSLPELITRLSFSDQHPLSLAGLRGLATALPYLSSLTCSVNIYKTRKGDFPPSLTHLSLYCALGPIQWDCLPPGLLHLKIRSMGRPFYAKALASIKLAHLRTFEFDCMHPYLPQWTFPRTLTRLVVNESPFDFGVPSDWDSEILVPRFVQHVRQSHARRLERKGTTQKRHSLTLHSPCFALANPSFALSHA